MSAGRRVTRRRVAGAINHCHHQPRGNRSRLLSQQYSLNTHFLTSNINIFILFFLSIKRSMLLLGWVVSQQTVCDRVGCLNDSQSCWLNASWPSKQTAAWDVNSVATTLQKQRRSEPGNQATSEIDPPPPFFLLTRVLLNFFFYLPLRLYSNLKRGRFFTSRLSLSFHLQISFTNSHFIFLV